MVFPSPQEGLNRSASPSQRTQPAVNHTSRFQIIREDIDGSFREIFPIRLPCRRKRLSYHHCMPSLQSPQGSPQTFLPMQRPCSTLFRSRVKTQRFLYICSLKSVTNSPNSLQTLISSKWFDRFQVLFSHISPSKFVCALIVCDPAPPLCTYCPSVSLNLL